MGTHDADTIPAPPLKVGSNPIREREKALIQKIHRQEETILKLVVETAVSRDKRFLVALVIGSAGWAAWLHGILF